MVPKSALQGSSAEAPIYIRSTVVLRVLFCPTDEIEISSQWNSVVQSRSNAEERSGIAVARLHRGRDDRKQSSYVAQGFRGPKPSYAIIRIARKRGVLGASSWLHSPGPTAAHLDLADNS
jgi:hypothetical protein